MGFGNFIVDTFTTSNYEAKRNEYRKLKNYLTNKKSEITRALNAANDLLRSYRNAVIAQEKGLQGTVFEIYDEKVKEAARKMDETISYMEGMLQSLQSRIDQAAERERYYQRKCDEEDEGNWGWN